MAKTFRIFTAVLLIPPNLLGWGLLAVYGAVAVDPEIASKHSYAEMALYKIWIPWGMATFVVGLSATVMIAHERGWKWARIGGKAALLASLLCCPVYAGYLALIWQQF